MQNNGQYILSNSMYMSSIGSVPYMDYLISSQSPCEVVTIISIL